MLSKHKHLFKILLLILFIAVNSSEIQAQDTDYHGFKCLEFKFEGRDAKIVFPKKPEL